MASTQGLVAASETAQDVAAAFMKFQTYVPDAKTEVAALISELFAISSALSELETALADPLYYRYRDDVSLPKYNTLRSLNYTFRDIQHLLAGLARPSWRSDHESYAGVWREIASFFERESGNTLVNRLEYYRLYLLETSKVAHGHPQSRTMRDLHARIDRLLQEQEDRRANLDVGMDRLSLGAQQSRRVGSWERRRPSIGGQNVPPPAAPLPGLRSRSRSRPPAPSPLRTPGYAGTPTPPAGRFTPMHSPLSPRYGMDEYGFPPIAPEFNVPSSPTTTTATSATMSTDTSSVGSAPSLHWIPSVFGQSRPTTSFKKLGTNSGCYGENMVNASSLLRKEYDELLRLPFDNNVEARVLIRPSDRRARILVKMSHGSSSHHRMQTSQPMTSLRVIRRESCLQFCTPKQGGSSSSNRNVLEMWANLRFASYERMILFYCTFLAMKAQDEANPISTLEDFSLKGEDLKFSGQIFDNNYRHILRILKDKDSGGVRLQASVCDGPMKNAPVWTAFINYKIMSRRWTKRIGPKRIQLGDLTRFIFDYDYVPPVGSSGEHELLFYESSDADDFMRMIDVTADEIADEL